MSLAPWVPSYSEQTRQSHGSESAPGWQYAYVYRILRFAKPRKPGGLPKFDPGYPGADFWTVEEREAQWEPNVDYDGIYGMGHYTASEIETVYKPGTGWISDGTVWMQHFHWRRRCPGMRRGNVRRRIPDFRGDLDFSIAFRGNRPLLPVPSPCLGNLSPFVQPLKRSRTRSGKSSGEQLRHMDA